MLWSQPDHSTPRVPLERERDRSRRPPEAPTHGLGNLKASGEIPPTIPGIQAKNWCGPEAAFFERIFSLPFCHYFDDGVRAPAKGQSFFAAMLLLQTEHKRNRERGCLRRRLKSKQTYVDPPDATARRK